MQTGCDTVTPPALFLLILSFPPFHSFLSLLGAGFPWNTLFLSRRMTKQSLLTVDSSRWELSSSPLPSRKCVGRACGLGCQKQVMWFWIVLRPWKQSSSPVNYGAGLGYILRSLFLLTSRTLGSLRLLLRGQGWRGRRGFFLREDPLLP